MEKLYVKTKERYSGFCSKGFIEFNILGRDIMGDNLEKIIANNTDFGNVTFKKEGDIYISYFNNLYLKGVLSIEEYYKNKWIMRPKNEMFIHVEDHIEESFELKFSSKNPRSGVDEEYYIEVINPSEVHDLISKELLDNRNIYYATLIRYIRKWKDNTVSEWEVAEVRKYSIDYIDEIKS